MASNGTGPPRGARSAARDDLVDTQRLRGQPLAPVGGAVVDSELTVAATTEVGRSAAVEVEGVHGPERTHEATGLGQRHADAVARLAAVDGHHEDAPISGDA